MASKYYLIICCENGNDSSILNNGNINMSNFSSRFNDFKTTEFFLNCRFRKPNCSRRCAFLTAGSNSTKSWYRNIFCGRKHYVILALVHIYDAYCYWKVSSEPLVIYFNLSSTAQLVVKYRKMMSEIDSNSWNWSYNSTNYTTEFKLNYLFGFLLKPFLDLVIVANEKCFDGVVASMADKQTA